MKNNNLAVLLLTIYYGSTLNYLLRGNLPDFDAVKHVLMKGGKKYSWKVINLWMISTILRIFFLLANLV